MAHQINGLDWPGERKLCTGALFNWMKLQFSLSSGHSFLTMSEGKDPNFKYEVVFDHVLRLAVEKIAQEEMQNFSLLAEPFGNLRLFTDCRCPSEGNYIEVGPHFKTTCYCCFRLSFGDQSWHSRPFYAYVRDIIVALLDEGHRRNPSLGPFRTTLAKLHLYATCAAQVMNDAVVERKTNFVQASREAFNEVMERDRLDDLAWAVVISGTMHMQVLLNSGDHSSGTDGVPMNSQDNSEDSEATVYYPMPGEESD